MNQEDYFARFEAEQYFTRTTSMFDPNDVIEHLSLRPNKLSIYEMLNDNIDLNQLRVLEVGCSVGDLLYVLRRLNNCEVAGVEPSVSASKICSEVFEIEVECCTFSLSSFYSLDMRVKERFDLIILDDVVGWMDPSTILPSLAAVDHLLAEEGHLFIRELFSPFSFRVPNHHHPSRELFNYRYGGGLQKYFCFGGQYLPLQESTRNGANFQKIETAQFFSIWRDSILKKSATNLFPVVEIQK